MAMVANVKMISTSLTVSSLSIYSEMNRIPKRIIAIRIRSNTWKEEELNTNTLAI